MTPATVSPLAPLLIIALVTLAPAAAAAQIASTRPASVSLTVVVPPRASLVPPAAVEPLSIVRQGANVIDVEASVAVAGASATRVEVSLGPEWRTDARVWVRNSRGDLERLVANHRVVTVDRSVEVGATPPTVRVVVECDALFSDAGVGIPLEYRVRVPAGDAVATWTFVSVLRVDSAP